VKAVSTDQHVGHPNRQPTPRATAPGCPGPARTPILCPPGACALRVPVPSGYLCPPGTLVAHPSSALPSTDAGAWTTGHALWCFSRPFAASAVPTPSDPGPPANGHAGDNGPTGWNQRAGSRGVPWKMNQPPSIGRSDWPGNDGAMGCQGRRKRERHRRFGGHGREPTAARGRARAGHRRRAGRGWRGCAPVPDGFAPPPRRNLTESAKGDILLP
jgi:hypothetical protein